MLEIRTTERNEPGVELPPPTISCLRAQEVVTAYFSSPDRQGSSGQAVVLGFACSTTAIGGPVGHPAAVRTPGRVVEIAATGKGVVDPIAAAQVQPIRAAVAAR